MRTSVVALSVVLLVLGIVPGWTGETRLPQLGAKPQMDARRVALDPRDPTRTRVGGLEFLGGIELTSRDPAFGGFSSLTVVGDRFTLLSDGGNIVRFRMDGDWAPHSLAFANLPAGPRSGWEKGDRDSESMAVDPVTGQIWVGFENANMIWRYAPGLAAAQTRIARPAMADWLADGGPESLARLPDGRFLAISELTHVAKRHWRASESLRLHSRDALLFDGDPTARRTKVRCFAYMPFGRYDPADAVALPNGDLIVLDRAFSLPFRWANRISIVPARAIRAGYGVRGRLVATLAAPLIHDNFEGVAVTREGDSTILWLVSDDNQNILQRSLLLKFRLAGC